MQMLQNNNTKQEYIPIQDQAIILQSTDGITIKEYARAIGNIIGSKAIKFLSRISNRGICMYLDSKHTVANLKHKSIFINNVNIEIKLMVLLAQRITLSNVSSIIPNSQIENSQKNITPLKVGITDPDLSHILSFRRQVYLDPEDTKHPELLYNYN